MSIVEENSTEEDDEDVCQCPEDNRCEVCMLRMIEVIGQAETELALELLNG